MPSQNDIGLVGEFVSISGETMEIEPVDNSTPILWVHSAGFPDGFTFDAAYDQLAGAILNEKPINRGKWQTLDVSQSPMHNVRELRNVSFIYNVPRTHQQLEADVSPDMPWAGVHFDERVSRVPMNPAPSYKIWPHHKGSADRHVESEVFSHTYPERFWPKHAGEYDPNQAMRRIHQINTGIRYAYGDLEDVVNQLVENPHTRQAVLPVWFPEDTGEVDVRVPCSLYYHFMSDGDDTLSVWYAMRSCDLVRHFRNDVYLAGRLLQWMCDAVATEAELNNSRTEFEPGSINMTISNLHVMEGDVETLKG